MGLGLPLRTRWAEQGAFKLPITVLCRSPRPTLPLPGPPERRSPSQQLARAACFIRAPATLSTVVRARDPPATLSAFSRPAPATSARLLEETWRRLELVVSDSGCGSRERREMSR